MFEAAQGIPGLPDLTQPIQLIQLGTKALRILFIFGGIVGFLGIALALLNFSRRQDEAEPAILLRQWLEGYSVLLRILLHGVLVFFLVITGFFICSTLATRYHFWERARVSQVAESVAGDRLEQSAPQVRYVVEEPYSYNTQVGNRIVRVQETRTINRFLRVSGSQIQVKIDQISDSQKNGRAIYKVDFAADYSVVNELAATQNFFFEVPSPNGYSLLQNFKVEQNGNRLNQTNPGEYSFPFRLAPGQEIRFRVTYQAQGAPRWVYNANGQLLSNFRLNVLANFPGADFASGIVPTEGKVEGKGTRYTWIFEDNVSVLNPFGVFTATGKVNNLGILPRLLILAPLLFIWWLLLLYLSLPMSWQNVAIAAGVFFACILTLTYTSRIIDSQLAWMAISLFLLALAWGLGNSLRASLAAVICTITGAILPVLGLLVQSSGLTLSLAALLSVAWLAVVNWHGFYRLNQQTR